MADPTGASDWAAPALLGAVLAALGYLGKLLADFVLALRVTKRQRRARLAELLALLRAGDAAFAVQCEIRDRLYALLREKQPDIKVESSGFDRVFALAHSAMTPEELELHTIIRAYTINTLKTLNDAILEWLRTDAHFRGLAPHDPRFGRLAVYLPKLEAHLLLWRAKYETWIPEHDERCLVYLADEHRHGVGFPPGGTQLLADLLGHGRAEVA